MRLLGATRSDVLGTRRVKQAMAERVCVETQGLCAIDRRLCPAVPSWRTGDVFVEPSELLDESSAKVLTELWRDARITNKEIAERTNLSEMTVASRIKSLEEKRLVRLVMQRDFRTLGHNVIALVELRVRSRRPAEVALELTENPRILSVCVTTTKPEIMLHVSCEDNASLELLVEQTIAPVRGVYRIEIITALEVLKYETRIGIL